MVEALLVIDDWQAVGDCWITSCLVKPELMGIRGPSNGQPMLPLTSAEVGSL